MSAGRGRRAPYPIGAPAHDRQRITGELAQI
jgi:hypothetical protein